MPTRILTAQTHPDLQPAVSLWNMYRPEEAPYRFQAVNPTDALTWQAAARPALRQTIGFQESPLQPLAAEQIEEVDKGDYIRQKWLLPTLPGALMPFYLLIPKGIKAPLPAVVAFHGHGYGVKDIVGLWEDGQERGTPDGYHADFGVALCRRGFMVAAPEISCFGERQTNFSYLNTVIPTPLPASTCEHTAHLALHLGGSTVGLRVLDGRRLIDYLETRPDVDMRRLGAMGISGGGMHTLFSTCVDERIRACVISGYYSTFRDSILAMRHCPCNFVPGLARFGEMYDLIGLIAPRPVLVESGSYDEIFPRQAVAASLERARSVYAVWGAGASVEADFYEGRHRISGRRAYDFLAEHLPAA
jgi:dienelactone hydrolase